MFTKSDAIARTIGVELIILALVAQKEMMAREIIRATEKLGIKIQRATFNQQLARIERAGLLEHRRGLDPISNRFVYYYRPTGLGQDTLETAAEIFKTASRKR